MIKLDLKTNQLLKSVKKKDNKILIGYKINKT